MYIPHCMYTEVRACTLFTPIDPDKFSLRATMIRRIRLAKSSLLPSSVPQPPIKRRKPPTLVLYDPCATTSKWKSALHDDTDASPYTGTRVRTVQKVYLLY